jgi:hypothetical protein
MEDSPFSEEEVSVVPPAFPAIGGFPDPVCAFIRLHFARAFWNQTWGQC